MNLPCRYRGYRYDTETELYYLQSRYYNPEWCRFINADVLIDSGHDLLGHNQFVYCNNSPQNYYDSTGMFPMALSIRMYKYAYGLKQSGTTIDFSGSSIGRLMISRLKKSRIITSRIKEYIGKINSRRGYYERKEDISFYGSNTLVDRDLSYSIGAALCYIYVEPTGKTHWFTKKKQYSIKIIIEDTYNFEKWDTTKKNGFTKWVNNNLGYKPQNKGKLKWYNWSIDFSYYAYY